jgi:hypothetical protein
VRTKGDEVLIRRDDAEFEVNPYRPGRIGGEDFLVSGEIDGTEQNARACLANLAHALAQVRRNSGVLEARQS